MKRIMGATLAGVLALGFVGTPAMAAQPQAEPTPVTTDLAWPTPDKTAQTPDEMVNVMVMLKQQPNGRLDKASGTASSASAAKRWDGKHGVKVRRTFGLLVRGFSASVPRSAMAEIAKDPDVASVTEQAIFYPSMGTAGDVTLSTQARKNRNIDGRGQVVAIIDTGIDIKHKDMRLDDDALASIKMQPTPGFTAKVPYGYNFADGNTTVKDLDTQSMHGMHVAGIVAANATDADITANNGIDGIAPNAQLLAMKVFSNNGRGGASEEDVVAAIEKSVELKADVLNLSLGSPNGNAQTAVGEGRAIAEAVKAGVEVAVAAGNEGLEFAKSADLKDETDLLDDGTLGTPSSTNAAFSIASVDNSHRMAVVGYLNNDKSFSFNQSNGKADNVDHVIVDCGLGKPEEIPADVAGKWCLIQRGEITFNAKIINAQSKGATGVVLYNNAAGSINPAVGDGVTIPVAAIAQADGLMIKDAISKGEAKVRFSDKVQAFPNPTAKQPSFFTSWGATPQLEFKPQLAGIGGSVWSTVNNNQYEDMSGTSMATPHVAGIFALARQEYAKRYPNQTPQERISLLRQALSNTAEILKQADGVPYAPRQIGAGLAQTDTALSTEVYVTVNGQPNVALKQVDGPRTITLTLTNKGSKDRTFTTGATCVVNEVKGVGMSMHTVCSATDKIAAAASQVTVKAGATATVDYTLTPDTAKRHWIEGWTQLTSTDAEQPSLSLPYMGFVGDWNAEPIITAPYGQPGYDFWPKLGAKTAYTTLKSNAAGMDTTLLGTQIWISPNNDGNRDRVWGNYIMRRSAQEIRYSVWSADGKTKLADLGKDTYAQRTTLYRMTNNGIYAWPSKAHAWDGTVYDPTTGKDKVVPDGTYIYRAEPCLGADDRCQVVDQQFRTDTVAPVVAVSETAGATGTSVSVAVTDAASGVSNGTGLVVTDAQTGAVINPGMGKSGTWTFAVPATTKVLKVVATDYAGNSTTQIYVIGQQSLLAFQGNAAFGEWINDKSEDPVTKKPLIAADGTITLPILASAGITKATLTTKVTPLPTEPGKPAAAPTTTTSEITLTNGQATIKPVVAEGTNEFTITTTLNGVQLSDTFTVKLDNTPPKVTLTNGADILTADGKVKLDADGTVTVKGTVWDNRATPTGTTMADGKTIDPMSMIWAITLGANGIEPLDGINPDGTFEITLKPAAGDTNLKLYFLDGFDLLGGGTFLNPTSLGLPIAAPATDPTNPGTPAPPSTPLRIFFDDERFDGTKAEPRGSMWVALDRTFKIKVVDGKAVLTVSGGFNRAVKAFSVNGKPVTMKGSAFTFDVDLIEGINFVKYSITDVDGTVIQDQWKWLYDKTLPSWTADFTPQVARDGAIWFNAQNADTKKVNVKGSVWDNGFGYTLKANGSVIKNFMAESDPGEKVNKQDYETSLPTADGQIVRMELFDAMGNGFTRWIPVHSDLVAPEVSIDGAPAAGVVTATTKITVKASDEHLDSLTVSVDGKQVAAKLVDVAADPAAKTEVVNEGDPSQPEVTVHPMAATQAVLTYELAPLTSGTHVVEATAKDLAGNVTSTVANLTVDEAPVITGPDAVTINPDNGDLLKQLQAIYKVTDNQPEPILVQADVTKLVLGQTVDLTLTATDKAGNVTTRVVKVTLDRPVTTLVGQCGSMTGKFAAGETITITCKNNQDGTWTVVVKNSGAPIIGLITLNGVSGPVVVLGPDGKPAGTIPGTTTFTGSSQATYLIGTKSEQQPPKPPAPVVKIIPGKVAMWGYARVGQTLTAAVSGWQPANITYTYQWVRSGKPIAGATGKTYTLTLADLNTRIELLVTGSYGASPKVVKSSGSVPVTAGIMTGSGRLAGWGRVGYPMSAFMTGYESGAKMTYTWYRNGVAIPGATFAQYRHTAADLGKQVYVKVTVSKPGYQTVTWTSQKYTVTR